MTLHSRPTRAGDNRGQTLVEFTLVAFLLVMVLIGVVEMSRMVLVYATISNAARAGARYAIVHGADNSATLTQVQTVVQNFLSAAPMTPANATITAPGVGGAVGSTVTVNVTYPYDTFTPYFPLRVNLTSSSQGVITF